MNSSAKTEPTTAQRLLSDAAICPGCEGTGQEPAAYEGYWSSKKYPCQDCNGAGRVAKSMPKSAFPSWGTVPTRPRCACCSRVIVVDINVPDDLWCAVMRNKHGPGYVCIDCFASRADEKMIDWGPHITFTPISMFDQIAVQTTPAAG